MQTVRHCSALVLRLYLDWGICTHRGEMETCKVCSYDFTDYACCCEKLRYLEIILKSDVHRQKQLCPINFIKVPHASFP